MSDLKLTLTVSQDGAERSIGFAFDKDVTKDYFEKHIQMLVASVIKKLGIEGVFDEPPH